MATKRRRCLTTEDAVAAEKQHTKPCSDCPWRRDSLNGWLGGSDVDQWLSEVHGECVMDCHVFTGAQCAGAAIYRRNILKRPRDPEILQLDADKVRVFANPIEFKKHHENKDK